VKKAGVDLEEQESKMHFAIHPGGPKLSIMWYGITKEQAHWSYEVLRGHGNMSSALPHIFNEIINGKILNQELKLLRWHFGPGLPGYWIAARKAVFFFTDIWCYKSIIKLLL
jgi:predicted naringenin-chalcone synthase